MHRLRSSSGKVCVSKVFLTNCLPPPPPKKKKKKEEKTKREKKNIIKVYTWEETLSVWLYIFWLSLLASVLSHNSILANALKGYLIKFSYLHTVQKIIKLMA